MKRIEDEILEQARNIAEIMKTSLSSVFQEAFNDTGLYSKIKSGKTINSKRINLWRKFYHEKKREFVRK